MNQEQNNPGEGRGELAKQLGTVSQACRVMSYSPDSFYRFKELYDNWQRGRRCRKSRGASRPVPKNRVLPEIEQAVAALAIGQLASTGR